MGSHRCIESLDSLGFPLLSSGLVERALHRVSAIPAPHVSARALFHVRLIMSPELVAFVGLLLLLSMVSYDAE